MMPDPRVVTIIQARMSSSRLPGKVLKDIAGKPMLAWVVERSRLSKMVDEVVVVTSTDPSDDPVELSCVERGYEVYRGDLYDVLDRYYRAARLYHADVIIRLTGDCPLIDPGVIDHTLEEFFKSGVDFAANRLPPPWKRTYPIGLDTEICTFVALQRAWKEAKETYQREHVMPYFYDKQGRFRVLLVNHDPDYGSMRWTVDTPEDLELVRRIVEHFQPREDFTWLEVLELFKRQPELATINQSVKPKMTQEVDQNHK
jgi:spore coat polysaccharide biosynthesis protein SpsF